MFVSKQAVTTDTRSVIGQTKILHAKKKIRSLLCHKTLQQSFGKTKSPPYICFLIRKLFSLYIT